jgi:hypothetical protein
MRFLGEFRLTHKRAPEFEVDQNLSFSEELDKLRLSTSGVAFIYASISVFVSRFQRRDVVVVLDDGREGTQLFRYEGKAISPRQNYLIHSPPGAYSDPPTASLSDLNLLYERCRNEFESLRAVGDASTGVLPFRRFRAPSDSIPVDRLSESPRDISPDAYEIEQQRDAEPGGEFARLVVSRLFVFITVMNILFAAAGWTGSVRYLFGLALGVAIPGWAIVGRLKLHYAALEVGLSIATSVAILIISAQTLITIHFWHLTAFDIVLSVAVLPSLLNQSHWPLSYRGWRR